MIYKLLPSVSSKDHHLGRGWIVYYFLSLSSADGDSTTNLPIVRLSYEWEHELAVDAARRDLSPAACFWRVPGGRFLEGQAGSGSHDSRRAGCSGVRDRAGHAGVSDRLRLSHRLQHGECEEPGGWPTYPGKLSRRATGQQRRSADPDRSASLPGTTGVGAGAVI